MSLKCELCNFNSKNNLYPHLMAWCTNKQSPYYGGGITNQTGFKCTIKKES